MGLAGSRKADLANISYSGMNNGEVNVQAIGNGGNDRLSADVDMLPGSTGSVGSSVDPSILKTTGKRDRISFTIHRGTDSTSTSNIFASVFDKGKHDVAQHTANVLAHVKGSNVIVP